MEDHYARKQGFPTRIGLLILALAITVIWFVIGVDQQGERVEEAELLEKQLPTIWLVYKDDVYKGTMLGYCWFGKCKDNAELNFTNHVIVSKGSNIGFVVNSIMDHTSMELIIHNSIINSDGSVTILNRLNVDMEEVIKDTYKIDIEDGTYVIIAHAIWEDIGYVDYIFSIKVV
ncbi:MAG: hypothetical protein KatS3mg003_0200 [Candidatus Nitrosocaldaceae archaeon]|nr:MAG: hypothetical protein KatS3mg003_0200 [Candidatus Nitrosocaldaceae archaeon]